MSRLAVLCMALLLCVVAVEAAWPQARWRRPVGDGPDGDIRPLHRKLHKVRPPRDVDADPLPPLAERKPMSRSYHFKHGPIFPEAHEHITESDSFYPPDHKLFY
jgi:hypothetical protein